MMSKALESALLAVKWDGNVAKFLEQSKEMELIDVSSTRLAVWSKQLENIDFDNPAISFVRAMQSAAHHAVCATSLGLYRASASSIRSMVENALYYSYFRSHPVELASLVGQDTYYISKSEIIAFHQVHTPMFKQLQAQFGFVGRLEGWYSEISAIVHGQVPGVWMKGRGISDVSFNSETLAKVVVKFSDAEAIVHDLLLLTCAHTRWDEFSHVAKKYLLKGMSGERKAALGLDMH